MIFKKKDKGKKKIKRRCVDTYVIRVNADAPISTRPIVKFKKPNINNSNSNGDK